MAPRTTPENLGTCRLLIDGYNLLYGIGLIQPGDRTKRGLEKARDKLIDSVAKQLPSAVRRATWIIFDSADAPKNLPDSFVKNEIHIFFSREWLSADEMLQAWISEHSSPKTLVVISSDHAVQRRATARSATPFDSEHWLEAIEHLLVTLPPKAHGGDRRESDGQFGASEDTLEAPERTQNVDPKERDAWLKAFGFKTDL
ncbi:MAG: NYN domain-containing protein [Pirellula sp.]